MELNVNSLDHIMVIINHFNRYPLLTRKQLDFKEWSIAAYIISKKEHLTKQGLSKIIILKSTINRGLPPALQAAFPNLVASQPKSLDKSTIIPSTINPYWLAGFVEAEGCFFIRTVKSKTTKMGWTVQLVFQITQHTRDLDLLNKIKEYLGYGNVSSRSNNNGADLIICSSSQIINIVLPFFR